MSIDMLCYVLAFLFFIMAGAGVGRFGWQWFAFAALVLAQII